MFFDNRKNVLRINKVRYIAPLVLVTLIAIIIWSGWFDKVFLGLNKISYIVCLSVLYILYVIIIYIINLSFFSYSDDGDKLVFRFVSFRPFDNAKKAIEIDKKIFGGYHVNKMFFNLKKELVLSIKTKKGLAKYPAISISALSDNQIKLLKNALNQFM